MTQKDTGAPAPTASGVDNPNIIDNGFYKINIQKLPPFVLESHAKMKEVAAQLSAVDRARMPEKLFKEYFLPVFSGAEQMPADSKIFAEWIGVAGSPTAQVDIVSLEGEVVLTAPPLMDTSGINITRSEGPRMHAIMSNFEMEKAAFPEGASKQLEVHLKDRSKTLLGQGNTNANRDRWKEIYDRYNGAAAGNSPDSKAAVDNQLLGGDDLEYD